MSSTTNDTPLLVAPEYTVTVGEATTKADFLEAIKADPCTEWEKLAIFTQGKQILYSNFDFTEKDVEFVLPKLLVSASLLPIILGLFSQNLPLMMML